MSRTNSEEVRSLIVKARVADSGIAAPTAVQDDMTKSLQAVFGKARVLEPPYDPRLLMRVAENSSALNQNVESYMTNIDGLGYRLEPVFDFDSSDTFEKVREAMWLGEGNKKALMPEDKAVEDQIIMLKRQAHLEELELKNFFQFMNPEGSFTSLRRETRQHLEITGNAFWEILRNNKGMIARAVIVPSTHVRLLPLDENPIEVEDKVKVGPLHESAVTQYRFFRRFVQAVGQRAVYFKEFGDPRVVSRDTGKIYPDLKTFQKAATKTDAPANEILHFRLPRPGEAYGIPRWIGSLLSVLGSRAADEVNYDYFDNKAIPPMALLVQGGRLGGDDASVISNYIRDHVRGRQNFHKMLIIEAVASDAQQLAGVTTQPTLKFERLTDTQLSEGQFQKYDERNIDKIGSAFRLPRIMRGDIRDFNKSCYSSDTETLTRRGWLKLGEFLEDDEILAYSADRNCFEWVAPERLCVFDVDEDLLCFRSNTLDICVTDNHRMLVRNGDQKQRSGQQFSVHRADSIPWTRYVLKNTGRAFAGDVLADFVLPKDQLCKIGRGHDHTTEIPANTFLEFLGYWVSEGSLLSTQHQNTPYLVTLGQKRGTTANKIRDCLDATGWAYSEQYDSKLDAYRWQLSNRCLSTWLRKNCGGNSLSKRLPDFVFGLEEKQTRILFDALMLGDGSWDCRGDRTSGYYGSSSKMLCDHVQILALRLGYRTVLSQHYPENTVKNHHAGWRLNISEAGDSSYREKPQRVHYKGQVYCFSVPQHGFYVTRRNGKVAVQGNTALAALRFAEEQVFAPERSEFDALLNRKILPELGISLWRFKTSGNRTRDPDVVSEIVERLVKANVVTINEGREILADALGIALPALPDVWAKQPIELTLAGWLPEGAEGEDDEALDQLVNEARQRAARQKPASGGAPQPNPTDSSKKVEEE